MKREKAGRLKKRMLIRRGAIVLTIIIATIMAMQSNGYSQNKKMTLKEKEDAWRAERLKKRASAQRMEFVNGKFQFDALFQFIVSLRASSQTGVAIPERIRKPKGILRLRCAPLRMTRCFRQRIKSEFEDKQQKERTE